MSRPRPSERSRGTASRVRSPRSPRPNGSRWSSRWRTSCWRCAQNAWCWLFAALSSALYLWLFAAAGLRMQAALQVFYIAMAGYGWFAWHRGRRASAEPDGSARSRSAEGMSVTRWSPRRHLAAVGIVVVVTCINAALLRAAPSPADAGSRGVGSPMRMPPSPGAACSRPGWSPARCSRTGSTGSCSILQRRGCTAARVSTPPRCFSSCTRSSRRVATSRGETRSQPFRVAPAADA